MNYVGHIMDNQCDLPASAGVGIANKVSLALYADEKTFLNQFMNCLSDRVSGKTGFLLEIQFRHQFFSGAHFS